MGSPSSESTRDDAPRIPGTVGVGRVFGVPIRLHFTFLLLIAFLFFLGLGEKQTEFFYLLYVLALFGSVLLHELGHAIVSRRYGISTVEIVMFPIGGVARLARQPKAQEELWIAIAGPVVNAVIAAVLLGYLHFTHQLVPVSHLAEPTDRNLLERIAVGNVILGVFNLLPAFPMDGGRILRALLVRVGRSEVQATRSAARTGMALAVLMGLYGLISMNFFLVFIAFFVYLGASQESSSATGRVLAQGATVRSAMVTEFRYLTHGQTIRDAADLLLATSQQDFPVLHAGRVIGLLGRNALLRAMAVNGQDSYVSAAMNRDFVRLHPDMDLAEALPLMGGGGNCALVMDGENLVGLLTAENIAEFMVLRRIGFRSDEEGQGGTAREGAASQ